MLDHSVEQLTLDAANARSLGVSYGQYKAMQKDGRLQLPKTKDKAAKQVKQMVGEKLCKVCGNPIPMGTRRISYCSIECSERGNREASRAYQRKRDHNKNKK